MEKSIVFYHNFDLFTHYIITFLKEDSLARAFAGVTLYTNTVNVNKTHGVRAVC